MLKMEDQFIIHGPKPSTYLDGQTLGNVFYDALLRYIHLPEVMINVHTKETLSFKELLVYSCRLAKSMKRWGLLSKDVVAIFCENCEQYFIPILAGFYTGIAVTTLNNNYTERELFTLIEIIKPTMIFCSEGTLNKILSMKSKFNCIKKIVLLNSPKDLEETECLNSFMKNNSDEDLNIIKFQPSSFNSDEQIAIIVCSSGTTGFPKAVALSHTNVRLRLIHSQDPAFTKIKPICTRFLQLMPMSHVMGLTLTFSYIISGYCTILMEKFKPETFLNSIETYKISGILLVPSLMVFLLKNPLVGNYNLSSIEIVGAGGAPVKKELSEAILKKFNDVHFFQGYGLTETSSGVIYTQAEISKLGSIGKIAPLVTAKVVDTETGKTLGPNGIGELCFKGPAIMKGYIKNEKATNEIIDKDGWLHSGDVGYYDEDYDFYIVDRLKDLIKYKGFQVSPSELEQIILDHPNVQDVGIVSVSDEIAGELPAACIVVLPGQQITEQEIKDFVTDKVSYPKYIRGGVYIVEAIPKNLSGKIDRRELKKMFETKVRNK